MNMSVNIILTTHEVAGTDMEAVGGEGEGGGFTAASPTVSSPSQERKKHQQFWVYSNHDCETVRLFLTCLSRPTSQTSGLK